MLLASSIRSITSCASAFTARLHLRSYSSGRVGGAKNNRRTYSSHTASPRNAYAMGDHFPGFCISIVDGGILGIPSVRSCSKLCTPAEGGSIPVSLASSASRFKDTESDLSARSSSPPAENSGEPHVPRFTQVLVETLWGRLARLAACVPNGTCEPVGKLRVHRHRTHPGAVADADAMRN